VRTSTAVTLVPNARAFDNDAILTPRDVAATLYCSERQATRCGLGWFRVGNRKFLQCRAPDLHAWIDAQGEAAR